MDNLTERQKQIFGYLRDQISDMKIPSYREIMKKFKFNAIKAVEDHLDALENKGYIRRVKGMARSIEIPGLRRLDPVELPILGRIAAGTPILAEENIEGTIAIDRSWVQGKNSFILKVQGNSMVDAGIHDGDYAIVKQNYVANNSDIVAALIEDEATLKRFYKEEDRIILKPENSEMEPIVIRRGEKNVSIIGKVTGIYRNIIR